MDKGQRLELADLEDLPVGSRVTDWVQNILVKQGDGTFKHEDGCGWVVSAEALAKAYGRVRFYDVPDPEEYPSNGAVVLVFDGPPGHQSGRFIEAEDAQGRSIKAGEWRNRGDGTWELRLGRDLSTDGQALTARQAEALFPMAPPLPRDSGDRD